MVMRGEVKVIENLAGQNTTIKRFEPIISECKLYERNTKAIRQIKEINNENRQSRTITNHADSLHKSMAFGFNDDKPSSARNTLDNLDEILERDVSYKFNDDYNKIKWENKFIYDFFKNVDFFSDECVSFVMNEFVNVSNEYYNVCDTKSNDFTFYFCLIFDSYLLFDVEEQKFLTIHDGLIKFLCKTLKNKKDEMTFVFKNIFLKKVFEALNKDEHVDKIVPLTELVFRIFEPTESQLADLFKLFVENVKSRENLYAIFSHIHDLLPIYPENIIESCLFYILSGVSSPTIEIRYHSLYILYKYMTTNINFYINFESNLF
jgi:hypothetical protein